jgi:PAS domain S-box-containing protein
LYGAVQDVTERKQADEALEASERRFRALVENSGMLINLINREGVLIYVSPSSARVVGYTPEEMTGRKAVEFLHPDEIPDKEQPFSQLDRKPGAVLKVERRVRHKDGTWRWVEGYSTNLLDDPAVGALVFNYRDITDRKRAEERFRLVVESAPNAIVMVDGSGKITLVNLQTEKFFGYARDELIGQRVEVLVPERHHAEHAGFRTGFMRNPAARPMGAGRDLFGLRKDGSEFPVEIGLNPIETEQGMMVLASIVDITDRKRAEAELRERQERLSSIYETVADVIFHLAVGEDGRYRFTSVNPAFLSVTGLRYDQVVGKRVDEVIPEPSLTMVLGRYETAIREKRTVRWEETSDYPTGRLTGEVSVAPVFDDAGRCTHLVGSVHDVTERRRAGEQNRFLANLVASVSDAVIAVDLQQNIQSWNTGAEAMYGWKEEEVLQRPAKDILDTDFLGDTREAVTKQIMEQGYWSGEVLQLHRDGTRIPTLSSVSLYKDGKGQPAGIVAVNRDITERKRSEEALAYSEERLNAIIEQSPLSIQVFSPAGDCIRANRGWEELWGSRREQLAGYNVLTDPQVKARGILPYLQRAFAGEIVSIPPLYYDPAETGQAGKARWTKAVIYPVKDSTGRIREVVLTHEDVTDRVFAEEKIRKLNEELEERVRERTAQLENANDELEAFSYSISHDLRAPLRSIDGFSRILLEEYGPTFDEEAKRLFNVVRSEARRMGQLIDDLLALSRLGRAEVKFKSIDMSAMAEKIFEELTTPEERARIDFRIGKLPTAAGDPSLIHQVWVNLIANAIKFTSKKDRAAIRVTGAKNAGENTYSVKDNGAGFELDYAGKLFGVFQRLHSEAEFEGTGVGLAIVKRVILRHGGRVWAEGEVDKGAAFHFSLPQKGAAA